MAICCLSQRQFLANADPHSKPFHSLNSRVARDIRLPRCYAFGSFIGVETIPTEYSLPDVLERLYQNQLALEAAVMELTLWIERKGTTDTGDNIRGALQTIGENAGHIKQGLAKLKARGPH